MPRVSSALRVFAFLFLLLSGSRVTAQSLSESDAYNLLSYMRVSGGCGIVIPLGEYNFPVPEAADGGDKHEFAQRALALDKVGVLNWIDLPGILGMAHFRLTLKDTVDRAQIVEIGSLECIRLDVGTPEFRILSITNIKGGQTRWDGAIILATHRTTLTNLFIRYLQVRNQPVLSERRIRFLIKYDPFTKAWKRVTSDMGPLTGDFQTQNVPQALNRD